MMARFREPLPLISREREQEIGRGDDARFEGRCCGVSERGMKPPKAVAWYPNRMSWQIDVSQSASLKQSDSEAILRLHAFLKSAGEGGGSHEAELVSMIRRCF